MPIIRRFRHKAMRSSLRVPLIWLRHRGLDCSDVFVASYPRAGQHWLRFQLLDILVSETGGVDVSGLPREQAVRRLDSILPKIGEHIRGLPVLPGGGRLIQTHERYRREYKKAIYLTRDVRDIVLSTYAMEKPMEMPFTESFEVYLDAFLRGALHGFGAWHAHVRSWLDSPLARNGNLMIVRYEDMRKDPEGELGRIVEFLGAHVDPEAIRHAVSKNSLQRTSTDKVWKNLPTKSGGESSFVRGSMGAWSMRLTDAQVEAIHKIAGEALMRLRYPLEPLLAVQGSH